MVRVSYMERRFDSRTVREAVRSVVRVDIGLGFGMALLVGETRGAGRDEFLLSDVLELSG